ncbi:MAG: VanZ family protein [Candidatus Coproplasma sp.]
MITKSIKLKPLLITLCALLLSFVYACFDELHQNFVNGRAATLYDVGIDAIGFTLMIAVSCAVYLLISYFVNKNASKKELQTN